MSKSSENRSKGARKQSHHRLDKMIGGVARPLTVYATTTVGARSCAFGKGGYHKRMRRVF